VNRLALNNIFARRSIRQYTDESVSEEQVKTLLEAAMAAPSASDRRPWHFIVVRERATLDALAERHPYAKMLFAAPLCIVPCADPAISDAWWVQDCSAATENLLLAATALGLGAVWVGVYPRTARVQAVWAFRSPSCPCALCPSATRPSTNSRAPGTMQRGCTGRGGRSTVQVPGTCQVPGT